MRVFVTGHAAMRFEERVRPGFDRRASMVELARLCEMFGKPCGWPAWAHGRDDLADRFFIEISDGIVVVCEPPRGEGLLPRAVTVLTRGGHGEGHEHRSARRRAKRRARRVAGPNYLDRASRPGRRDALRPEIDEAA